MRKITSALERFFTKLTLGCAVVKLLSYYTCYICVAIGWFTQQDNALSSGAFNAHENTFCLFQAYERMNVADALVPKTFTDGELIIKQVGVFVSKTFEKRQRVSLDNARKYS